MPLIRAVVNGVSGLLRKGGGLAGAVKCCCGWVCAYTDAVATSKDCYPKGQQPYPASDDTEYKNETECRKYCDSEYVCAWKSNDPDLGKECVKKGTEASPSLIISTYYTPDCDGMCVDEYYCCVDADGNRTCRPGECEVYGENPDGGPYDTITDCDDECKKTYTCRTSDYDCVPDPDGPYDSLKECEEYCKDTRYYCCQSPGGPKECHLGGCPIGMSEVGGPYVDYDECETNCKPLYYCCQDATGARSCYPDECPSGTTTVGVYTDETECNDKCPVYYVCAQKSPYPVDGYECVAWNDAIDPSVIVNQYDTPDCDGECPPDPVYFCCEDASGDKDCYKYGCPPDRTEAGGPYSTPGECSSECDVKYYCCEDSEGNKTCRKGGCEYYGENAVSGPYDTLYDCEPECEKYYCCEDSNGERNCYKGNCPAGTEEKGGPYDDDVACKEAACAKVYWYCTAPDKCESGDSGPYDSEDACLDAAPEDCKVAYTCQDNGDGTKTCVQDPNGEYDEATCGGNCPPPKKKYACVDDGEGGKVCVEDPNGGYTDEDCGGDCEKPKQKYACVDGQCVPDPNGGYDDPNCNGACTKQKYACVNGVCEPDDNGPYDEPTCGGNCKPKQKYSCAGGACVPDANGPYEEDTCGGNCAKPECVVDADCGCDFPDKWFEGFGCCQDGQVPKPGTNLCWEDGRPGTETSIVAAGVCCNGKCREEPYLPQPDVNGASPCKKCSACDGEGFSGGPYGDLLSLLEAYGALGVSWPLSETLCSDGFYFETCPRLSKNPLP